MTETVQGSLNNRAETLGTYRVNLSFAAEAIVSFVTTNGDDRVHFMVGYPLVEQTFESVLAFPPFRIVGLIQ